MSARSTVVAMDTFQETRKLSDFQVSQIAKGTPSNIADSISQIAEGLGIAVRRLPSDEFARAASRLSDAEVDLDEFEQLLVALSRARVITPLQRGLLQVNYLR